MTLPVRSKRGQTPAWCVATLRVWRRCCERAFVRASGPDAVSYLQSMVTNDVEAIAPGGGTYALLLTPRRA